MSCRCGRDDVDGQHLCHWGAYTCPEPGTQRLYYDGHPFSVAGATLKLSVNETWSCDEHWEQFKVMLNAR